MKRPATERDPVLPRLPCRTDGAPPFQHGAFQPSLAGLIPLPANNPRHCHAGLLSSVLSGTYYEESDEIMLEFSEPRITQIFTDKPLDRCQSMPSVV